MKKLKDLNGVKVLKKKDLKPIQGGSCQDWNCITSFGYKGTMGFYQGEPHCWVC